METQLTLIIVAGVGLLFVLGVLWPRPEYGLLLYGIIIGFPDLAFPLGPINVRLDDCLIALFLPRVFLWGSLPTTAGQRSILTWQMFLIAFCFLSGAVGVAKGVPPPAYETLKMAGCAALLIVLPKLLQSERSLRFLVFGLLCGGGALIIQIALRLSHGSTNILANFHELKNAATFATWNPNTIGQVGILLTFSAGVGWVVFPRSPRTNWIWFCLATAFFLPPVLLFARGSSIALFAGLTVFLCLMGRWKLMLLFMSICVLAVAYMHDTIGSVVDNATHIDVSTGEGFSHRYDRWEKAAGVIAAKPIMGHGFAQESPAMGHIGGEGRAHDAYLTVWIELGLVGLVILLLGILQYSSVGVSLFKQPASRASGALLLSLVVTVCIDSVGLPTLYWEKLPQIAFAIGIAVVGVAERAERDTFPRLSSTYSPRVGSEAWVRRYDVGGAAVPVIVPRRNEGRHVTVFGNRQQNTVRMNLRRKRT